MVKLRSKIDTHKENNENNEALRELSFVVKLANLTEKMHIMKIMASEYRQTMNLRLMPEAQLILLQDKNNNVTVGWIGVDYQYNSEFPETFSLFIFPKYRGNHLSLVLKHAAHSILYAKGKLKSYARMEASHNQELIKYNVKTGLYRILTLSELNPDWQRMCSKCELYGKNCKSQVYLEVDVEEFVNSLNFKLGKLHDVCFPKLVALEPELIANQFYFPQWEVQNSGDKHA